MAAKNSGAFRVLVSAAVAGFAVVAPLAAEKDFSERDADLAEADRKAFEANMAASQREVRPLLDTRARALCRLRWILARDRDVLPELLSSESFLRRTPQPTASNN